MTDISAGNRPAPTTTLGYTIFYVEDVGECLTFFTEAFGFAQRMHTPENDYGELATGETILSFVSLELARANLEGAGGFVPPDASRPCPASVTLTTSDLQGVLASAVSAGARTYVDPVDKPWGQTVTYVLGPSNILIELATPVGD